MSEDRLRWLWRVLHAKVQQALRRAEENGDGSEEPVAGEESAAD